MKEENAMDNEMLMSEEEALDFAAYLIACADISRYEPDLYGSVRLLEAARRLAQLVIKHRAGKAPGLWGSIHDEIEQKLYWYEYDLDGWNAAVDELPVLIAREL